MSIEWIRLQATEDLAKHLAGRPWGWTSERIARVCNAKLLEGVPHAYPKNGTWMIRLNGNKDDLVCAVPNEIIEGMKA